MKMMDKLLLLQQIDRHNEESIQAVGTKKEATAPGKETVAS